MQTVSLSFFRYDSLLNRLWALAMMGAARLSMPRVAGIGFWKLCGSGTGEGFMPLPNTAVYAILATWPDEATARRQTAQARIFQRYRRRAVENWTVFLTPTSARGVWSGVAPFTVTETPTPGPLAALTRATVKPSVALKFWRRVPDISQMIGSDTNVAFKIGIGEVPLFHQVTFSIWPDTDSMAAFAREDGPHARAVRAVREGNWFREELYARFRVLGDAGSWQGGSPLTRLDRPA
ncbi:spheroidene monooxygenase [Seohaeicola saemankumensis]|uniref:spheroidene monooxygenase n=1 Tax=Seohaeicola saemankumensis TaxID=481181 RepID=UPI001E33620E|nr:spheroidene monooxygenase [Seohaeicola saemankumensis]MCD1627401.1 spheroidene monooxygenase [Seohaeicola saemankumensis]